MCYRVVVVLAQKVYIYNFQHLDLADSFVTYNNPGGLVSLSVSEANCVLSVPDEKLGHIRVINFTDDKKTNTIKCHNSGIAAMKLSQDGTILLTASDKGTLVRLFNTETGEKMSEVRRGAD